MTTEDEAKVTPRQHRNPCHDCPWRRTAIPGWLGGLSVEAWIAQAHSDGIIDCHTRAVAPGRFHQCAGASIYRANIFKSPRDPEALRLSANRKAVFGFNEFELHHHGGRR